MDYLELKDMEIDKLRKENDQFRAELFRLEKQNELIRVKLTTQQIQQINPILTNPYNDYIQS